MADNKGNKRIGSFNFDAETKLEVMQRGGGGAGVGGEDGLAAVNLVTGESTNDALAEKDETIAEQAATIEEQAGTIEEQAGEISDLEDEVAAKQAIIDAFPTIEALSVTANGTYNEEGKAYKPVVVNVASGWDLTEKGVYEFKITNNSASDVLAITGGVTQQNNKRQLCNTSVTKINSSSNANTPAYTHAPAFGAGAASGDAYTFVCLITDTTGTPKAIASATGATPTGVSIFTSGLSQGRVTVAIAPDALNPTGICTIDLIVN